MAYATVTIPGDGSTRLITASFALGVIADADVSIRVSGEVDGSGNPIYRTYTRVGTDQYMVAAPAAAVGKLYIVERRVDKEHLLVDWDDGDAITEENLNLAQKQALMIAHEALDEGLFAVRTADGSEGPLITKGTDGQMLLWDANGNIIPGADGDDIANAQLYAQQSMAYRDQSQVYSNQSLSNANLSLSYSTTALGYSNAASDSATVASVWAAKSQEWATSSVLVDGVDFSAKYYANQSFLNGGTPVGTIIAMYCSLTSPTPPGYIPFVSGGVVTSTYAALRTWALAAGWLTSGGNPIMPAQVGGAVMRAFEAGQTVDAGRVFTTGQLDQFQGHGHDFLYGNAPGIKGKYLPAAAVPSGSGVGAITNGITNTNSAGALSVVDPNTDGVNGTPRVGTETRMHNFAVRLFIKAYAAQTDVGSINLSQLITDQTAQAVRITALEANKDWEIIETVVASGVASYIRTGLSAFRELRFSGDMSSSTATNLVMQFSNNGGSTWIATADHYMSAFGMTNGTLAGGANNNYTNFPFSWNALQAGTLADVEMVISKFNKVLRSYVMGRVNGTTGAAVPGDAVIAGYMTAPAAHDSVRIMSATGLLTGNFKLMGRRG